jgi:hypothetical protein
MTQIRSKNSLYSHKHFTEHLVDTFKKLPCKSDLNHKTSNFSIRQLKNYTEASPATIHKQHEEVSHQNHQKASHSRDAGAAWAAAEPPGLDNIGTEQKIATWVHWPHRREERWAD